VMAGAGQFGHPGQGIFAYWIHSFRENAPLKYLGFGGNGYQVRDCLHPQDLLPLLRQQMHRNTPSSAAIPRILNVSGGLESSISLAQLTQWCRGRFPKSKTYEALQQSRLSSHRPAETLEVVAPSERRFDIPWMILDASGCEKNWAWSAETKLHSIFEEIAEHAESHPGWLGLSMP